MTDLTNILECVREEDFVEYFLFPEIEANNEQEQELLLDELRGKCEEIVGKITKDHLWHKDEFSLLSRGATMNKLVNYDRKNANFPPHLYGVTHFGDNIEDEWFIVHILSELTRQIPKLVAKVCDVDGEFLLIESAEFLPQWINPDTAENRVYLYNGKVHILKPGSEDEQCELNCAITEVRSSSSTEAQTDIQDAISKRINVYPAKIKENHHTAKVYVPIGVATILKHQPNLISGIVHAFCNRDPIDLKACRAMKYFPPENRVYTNVKFPKCLYAMLSHSKFVPDRRVGWNLPPVNSSDYKSHSLGMKIACGFEILASQAKPSENLENDKSWHKYLKSLNEKNYFNGLLEHSRDYNHLMNKAKEYYINHRDSMYISPLIGQKILDLLKNIEINVEEFRKELDEEDDDSWLNISPEELDKYLLERYGQKKINTFNNNSDAGNFSQKITSFLNHVSDIDGAEFPNASPVRPPRNKKTKDNRVTFAEEIKRSDNNKINFDPSSFGCAVQNILDFVIPDDSWDLESDSEMSDYEDDNFVKDESCNNEKTEMQTYMDEMDRELAATTIGDSFVKKNGDAAFEDIENFKPVDIDVNALKNILESYKSQLGEAGPSSNMLGPMGIHLDVSED